ncbi:TPA: hypothetical protein N0F65_006425 [Lagenidium giganteum]|uniref:Protein ENHANCED DISEASE RESISTANCE 2 C-terminal domain-containing protein n=1 Tax=Lagenidium giganteum TaxID=4803 RepID=A0AAV2YZR8_9STRA|nr:TPA: hypothetical protein N0F65_006425 [Lagenidium giganteum]
MQQARGSSTVTNDIARDLTKPLCRCGPLDQSHCRRKSCGRLEIDLTGAGPLQRIEPMVPLELHRLSCEDNDDADVPEVSAPSDGLDARSTSQQVTVNAQGELEEAYPFGVHCHEIRPMWMEPDCTTVEVRSASYLQDQLKVASGSSIGQLLHFDMWTADSHEQRTHIGESEQKRPHSVLKYCQRNFPDSLVFILNIQLPDNSHTTLASYWLVPMKPAKCEKLSKAHQLFLRFCNEEDDEFRNHRFKMIPNLVTGPWLLKQVAPNRPAITGTKLRQRYFRRANYFELDLDVASSTTAAYIGSLCQSWSTSLILDIFMTIQGEDEDQLPEQVFGGVRLSYLDLALAKPLALVRE